MAECGWESNNNKNADGALNLLLLIVFIYIQIYRNIITQNSRNCVVLQRNEHSYSRPWRMFLHYRTDVAFISDADVNDAFDG